LTINGKDERSTNIPIMKKANTTLFPEVKKGSEKEEMNKNLNATLAVPNTLLVRPITWLGM
jgi:hypothetical protein